MSCDDIQTVEPKRSGDTIWVNRVDWHDVLANFRESGVAVALNAVVRLSRLDSTGLQYRATTAGITSGARIPRRRWPTTIGGTLTDGSVVWTAEVMSVDSLRTSVVSDDWLAVSGLAFGSRTAADMIYQIMVDGGVSGQTYDLVHRITCANGEVIEQKIRLPVED